MSENVSKLTNYLSNTGKGIVLVYKDQYVLSRFKDSENGTKSVNLLDAQNYPEKILIFRDRSAARGAFIHFGKYLSDLVFEEYPFKHLQDQDPLVYLFQGVDPAKPYFVLKLDDQRNRTNFILSRLESLYKEKTPTHQPRWEYFPELQRLYQYLSKHQFMWFETLEKAKEILKKHCKLHLDVDFTIIQAKLTLLPPS